MAKNKKTNNNRGGTRTCTHTTHTRTRTHAVFVKGGPHREQATCLTENANQKRENEKKRKKNEKQSRCTAQHTYIPGTRDASAIIRTEW